MNVIGHKNVSPDTNTKIRGAAAVFDENLVYFGSCEQTCASVGIKRYEIDRPLNRWKIKSNRRGLSLNVRCTLDVVVCAVLSAFEDAAHAGACALRTAHATALSLQVA
jgi:hypothetical protein